VKSRRTGPEPGKREADKSFTMPTKSIAQDRKRISAQKHEVSYAGSKLGKGGAAKILRAKRALGRTTSRTKVMARAEAGR
jgi:hypothetical protein